MLKLGISPELAKAIKEASLDDLHRVAHSSFMLFQPRGNQQQFAAMLSDHGLGRERISYFLAALKKQGRLN